MDYLEFALKVAEGKGLSSVAELEDIYGDMIQDCYDAGDSVEATIQACLDDDFEYEDADRRIVEFDGE